LDAGGALRVGPESAGADPGPIIYARGGQQITVSDANALLGRIDPDHFLGGHMTLDMDSPHKIMRKLARQMNRSIEDAAQGVIDVANVNIDRAVRRVSIARGYDPRQFTLMAFGGAGPLHACAVADRLEMPRVLIPRYPGVLCAFGLLVADVLRDYSQTLLRPVTGSTLTELRQMLKSMIAQARTALRQEGIAPQAMTFVPSLDMRYVGQSFEINIPFNDDIAGTFHAAHESRYGHALPDRAVEVVNARLQAVGRVDKPVLAPESLHAEQASPIQTKNGFAAYDRDSLLPGMQFTGPALVFQLDSTAYIAPGWSARVDAYRNLILERG
jgi:N-methylhydantoinase A/oxoprolinase/acetone carboxylase beta subunit